MAWELLREFASYPALMGKLLRNKRTVRGTRVPYGTQKDQYLLHFAPPGAAREKIIVYIHGGGWNSGTPDMFFYVGQCFAREGYHCVLPGYRKAPRHRYPAQIEDVCAGYEKGRCHLKEQGIETGNMVVVGSSAGGHLGALLCYDSEWQKRFGIDLSQIRGFVGLGGVYRFDSAPTLSQQRLVKGLFPPGEDRTRGEPYHKLEEGQNVPMLVVHGKGDGVVSYQNAVEFSERAGELCIPAEFYEVPPKGDTYSVYTAGIFLEERGRCPTLDRVMDWIERL